jgi:hypothetical protein
MQYQNSSDQPQVKTPVVEIPVEYLKVLPEPSQTTDPTFYVLALVVFISALKTRQ